MSQEYVISSYPVLYNPELVALIKKCEQPIPMFQEAPINEQIENYREEPTERRSAIIDSLYYALRKSESDYNSVSPPKLNGKIRHDNIIRADVEDYYNYRVGYQSEEIIQCMMALIQLDGWNEGRFANYKIIKNSIDSKNGMEKALELNRLRLMGFSTVPKDVKFEEVRLVEPAISGNMTERRM